MEANVQRGRNDELPRLVEALFPVCDRREDRFIAGLSMGGYGAFRTALSFPERYAAAASLSGTLDVARLVRERVASRDEFQRVFEAGRFTTENTESTEIDGNRSIHRQGYRLRH